ncbi:MAG: Transcriptional regulator, MarR family [Chlorobi bacterium]|nr:Transcriptional regulator, MarR family [Chlorobiota bacterium]
MGDALKKRLKQTRFQTPAQEAFLNLLVSAAHVSGLVDGLCAEFGLSHQQYNILRILRGVHPEGYACGEVAERMLDRAPDVTRRMDALVKSGLVSRGRLSQDRRVVITKITEEGLVLLVRMEPRLTEMGRHFEERLSDAECREFSRLCEKLYGE